MKKPNILFITTHDTGRHLGCYGIQTVNTPGLDQLAAEGIRFTNFFAASALCSPSRGALMTGRCPQTNGMMGLCHPPFNWSLNEGEKHLSHLLHGAGYHTILLGHQHETRDIDSRLGFDEHGIHRYPDTLQHRPCNEVADGAEDFLRDRAGQKQPFYLQIGFFETHRPFDFGGVTPDASKGVHAPPYLADNEAAREQLALFQGNIKKMDTAAGRILKALRGAGLEENTIVLYTADHGIDFPRAKRELYDAGTGVALLMRWPGGGISGGKTCDWLLGNVDVLPTLMNLADVPQPDNLEGVSFASAFADGGKPPREHVYTMMQAHGFGNEARAVRSNRHKLIRHFEVGREYPVPVDLSNPQRSQPRAFAQLFDMEKDPLEQNNLADDPALADVRRELETRLWSWLDEVNDPILEGPVRPPFYESAIADFRQAVRVKN